MRILAVTVAHGFSSEVRVASTLLGAPGIEATVVVQSSNGDTSTADKVASLSGARVVPVDVGWRPEGSRASKAFHRLKLAREFPGLLKLARAFNPTVIYSSQQIHDCTLATTLAKALRKPQVIHLHYVLGPFLGRLPLRRLRSADLVVTVSHFIRSLMMDYRSGPEGIETVLNSIELPAPPAADVSSSVRRELGFGDRDVIVGMVGRFAPWKGQLESVEALAATSRVVPDVKLVFAGDGDNVDDVKARCRSLGVEDRVRFLGRRSDVDRLLAAFDVFIHPSYNDPCPLAVLEAQAAGLPVVAFAEGGIPEIVQSGATGLLSPPRDVPGLSDALQTLAANQELRRSFGAAARERMRSNFSTARARHRFLEVLGRFEGSRA